MRGMSWEAFSVESVTKTARRAFDEWVNRNGAARFPVAMGEWRFLKALGRDDGGIFVFGIYKPNAAMYGKAMEGACESIRKAIYEATSRLCIVEILWEEPA